MEEKSFSPVYVSLHVSKYRADAIDCSTPSHSPVVVRCLSIGLWFSKHHIHVWKQRSWVYFVLLQDDMLLSCVLVIRHQGCRGSSDNISLNGDTSWWWWEVRCLSRRSRHWRAAVTGKSWSHSSLRKCEASLYIGEATSGICFSSKTWQVVNYCALIQA